MVANDLRHDAPEPDPPTPEERYHYTHEATRLYLSRRSDIPDWVDMFFMVAALRDMIASRDAELERQSVAINKLEQRIEILEQVQRWA